MLSQNPSHIPSRFYCDKCNYGCSKKGDFNKHINSIKHNAIHATSNATSHLLICGCGKDYKHRSSFYRHKKNCTFEENTTCNKTTLESMNSTLVIELLKQNNEFKNLMIEQNRQNKELHEMVIDLAKKSGNTTTTNNNNTVNNTTNKFNLNVFLNETCKDAINLNDFIQSIELNPDDFIRTGEIGYVRGISDIMVERIRDMDPHTRPIHCTDLKRETVYVKDSDKWSKEDENKTHLRKAVKIVAGKNQAQVHTWIKQNPNYEILDTPECDKYFEYTKVSLGGCGKEEDTKFENKIMNNVLKETVIDKN